VDERSREIERRFQWPLLVLALLTIPVLAIEYSDTGQPWQTIATVLNWCIWLGFLSEFLVMLWVVPDRWLWIRNNPLDLAIVVLTPPFLPESLQAARVFRLFLLLRLAKAGVLLRHLLSTEGIRDAAVLGLVAVLGGGAAFAAFEKDQDLSAWDGVWWAATTVTTVGYGNPEVTTDGGRIVAMFLMVTGIGFVALVTAAAAERFVRSRRAEERAREERLAIEARAQEQRQAIEDRLDRILARLDRLETK
jgi:voltage-gated potassium channel